jgi:pyridinium-3,5-biscarboxylic acid mononucleotide sulfurtransferase
MMDQFVTDQRSVAEKREDLHRSLAEAVQADELLLVSYSGGVDSAYLAWEAHVVLGERMLAVIADSASLPRKELAAAIEFAEVHSIPLRVVRTSEMQSDEYVRNDAARCFHCKDELFRVMEKLSKEFSATKIAYGRNLDDKGDFRPGQRAAEQHSVLSPLVAAGLNKADVRALAKHMGLSLWDKPAAACLSSRVEYGRMVTVEALGQIELAEEELHRLGFRQVRVRYHGEMARIEIDRSELPRALTIEMLDRISVAVRGCGFKYVAVDADGYRSGGMNEKLTAHDMIPVKALTMRP